MQTKRGKDEMQRKPPKEEWMPFSICWPPIHCPPSNIRDNKRRGMSAIYIPTLAVFQLSKTQLLYIHSWDEWMDTSRSQRLQIFFKICAKNHTFHNKRKIKSSSTKLSLNGPFPHYQDHNKWWRWAFSLSTMYFDHTVSFWLMMDTSLGQRRPIFGGQ